MQRGVCLGGCLYLWLEFGGNLFDWSHSIPFSLEYHCRDGLPGGLIVFIFGRLGHLHRLVELGMRAKWLAKYCPLSAIIGSCGIWQRRCYIPNNWAAYLILCGFVVCHWSMTVCIYYTVFKSNIKMCLPVCSAVQCDRFELQVNIFPVELFNGAPTMMLQNQSEFTIGQ